MSGKVTCPKCGESNYATDRQCLSCGTDLTPATNQGAAPPAAAPAAHAPQPRLPARMASGDDRSWWRRRVDDVSQYERGALIGMVAVVLLLAGPWVFLPHGFQVAVFLTTFYGVAAFCFVWYVRDPDSIWPLVVCIFVSSLIGWLFIALGAFVGAAIEKQTQRH